jgi:galactokinase
VKGRLHAAVRSALAGVAGIDSAPAFWVPGRIEVLGKHTDYAGGRSLICAVERGFVIVAVPRNDSLVRVLNLADGSEVMLALDARLPDPPDAWMRYPATVLRRVARNFPDARRGADVAFLSDLPPASGMSSSSAFIVAVFLAIAAVNQVSDDARYQDAIATPDDLAGYLATVENGQSFGPLTGHGGVGTFGGSEDHTAMLCCRAGELSQYSFCPVRHERQVPLPAGSRFVVAVSGVKSEKTGAAKDAYNSASLAVRAILDAWRAASGRPDGSLAEAVAKAGAQHVRDVIERETIDGFGTAILLDRFDQFVEESEEIVPAAASALAASEMTRFGALVDRSQELAERQLRNQVPETVHLARTAREHGAVAASAFGAGFGGSVWALVHDEAAADFEVAWARDYERAFPGRSPSFLVTRAGPAASALNPMP